MISLHCGRSAAMQYHIAWRRLRVSPAIRSVTISVRPSLPPVSSGFRIYSAWGLNVIDIAKIAFITGLTFWLGNAFVLGGGMAYAPAAASAIDQLPPLINRTMGALGLATIVGYLLWLRPRPRIIGRSSWQIILPSPRSTLVQIGIGVLDLGAGAIAMHALLPAYPSIDFMTLLVIFVAAILLGFASHAPGSLGFIEVAMFGRTSSILQ